MTLNIQNPWNWNLTEKVSTGPLQFFIWNHTEMVVKTLRYCMSAKEEEEILLAWRGF